MASIRAALGTALCTLAALCAPAAATAEPAPGPAGWLYGTTTVADVHLTLPQPSIDGLADDPGEYQPGTLSLHAAGRAYGPLQVGIRLRGESSFRPLGQKAGFEVELDAYVEDQTIAGVETLTLNSMVQDATGVREALAYEAFRRLGVPAPRTGYALVSVNGAEYGLYLNLETLDAVSLARWFASTRHLYEAAPGNDVRRGAAAQFGVDEGNGGQRDDLEALIAAANADAGDWSDRMAGVADLEQLTTMWAVERYIGHWDGYAGALGGNQPDNYYLHSESSGLFRMLPSGTDQTWGQRLPFETGGGLMFDRCLEDPGCAAGYREALRRVRTALAAGPLADRVGQLAALVAPLRSGEPLGEHTDREFEQGVADMLDFVADRPGELAGWLDEPSGGRTAGEAALAATPLRARLGRLRARRAAVRTRVTVPVAGAIEQRGLARIAGRRLTVCSIEGEVLAGETVIVVCRLTDLARKRLLRGPLTVHFRTSFLPSRGPGAWESDRSVVVPQLKPGKSVYAWSRHAGRR